MPDQNYLCPPSERVTDPPTALFLTALAVRECYPGWEQIPETAGVFDDSFDDSFE